MTTKPLTAAEVETLRQLSRRYFETTTNPADVQFVTVELAKLSELRAIEQRARELVKYSTGGRTAKQAVLFVLGEL